jgi:hypothetical protein
LEFKNEKSRTPIARRKAALACGLVLTKCPGTDYGLSVAPFAGAVVSVVSVAVPLAGVFVPVPVPVVVVSSLHPATTNAPVIINIANKLLIAMSPEM